MGRIPRRVWRTIHWLAYAAWPLAFLHSIDIGSDSGTLWLRVLAVASLATIVAAVGWRVAPLCLSGSRSSRVFPAKMP